jgi:hypothetical protein
VHPFLKSLEEVWFELKYLCKSFERNKKTEKEKKKENKNRKGPQGSHSAQSRKRPTAQEIKPETVPSFLSSPRRQVGPTCHLPPPADSSPSLLLETAGITPLLIPH